MQCNADDHYADRYHGDKIINDNDYHDGGILIDAGVLPGDPGESDRVALHKVFSSGHFVTLHDWW